MKYCPNCHARNDNVFYNCYYCGRPLPVRTSAKIFVGVMVGAIFLILIILAVNANLPKENISMNSITTTSTTVATKTGIDPAAFDKMVKEKVDLIDEHGLIGEVETNISFDNIGTVKLYLSDLSEWSYMADVKKKEFINVVGDVMEKIAGVNTLPGTESIAVSTEIYSPSGLLLGERTVWGNVKLK